MANPTIVAVMRAALIMTNTRFASPSMNGGSAPRAPGVFIYSSATEPDGVFRATSQSVPVRPRSATLPGDVAERSRPSSCTLSSRARNPASRRGQGMRREADAARRGSPVCALASRPARLVGLGVNVISPAVHRRGADAWRRLFHLPRGVDAERAIVSNRDRPRDVKPEAWYGVSSGHRKIKWAYLSGL
jgi:hypothetical protein